jgi:L-asparaginase II
LAKNRAVIQEIIQMHKPVAMAEVWRGDFLECVHMGHGVVCDTSGDIVQAWGDPNAVILPRSSSKMMQALPLIESGAADAFGLTPKHLALVCASHEAAAMHIDPIRQWHDRLDLKDSDLLCGPQTPRDPTIHDAMIRAHESPCRIHNNCSGKHTGFLTYSKHIGAGPDYVEPSHPLQVAVRDAFETLTGMDSPGFGIDGCSAPNFATSVHGLARAMAYFASARDGGSTRDRAAVRLVHAMTLYPELVCGEGRASTEITRALGGDGALKGGAEGVFVAILPKLGLGVAVKITDGATNASEVAIAAILAHVGALSRDHPNASDYLNAPQRNYAGLDTGFLRPAAGFPV